MIATSPASHFLVLERIQEVLRHNPYRALRRIQCEVNGGRVILKGMVGTYYLKQLAQAAIFELDGIREIDNQIEVISEDGD